MFKLKNDYYIPKDKTALICWFVANMGYTASSLKKFPTKQLYAMYHKARQRMSDKTKTIFEVLYECAT